MSFPSWRDPRVYLLEDLHWLDQASEAFVEQLVEAVAGTRNLLLLSFRPEYHADWMGRSWYRQLPLAPLGADAIRELLEDLLGSDSSTRGLADAIHERTGGNPFFTEEVVQSLIESGRLEGARRSYRLVTAASTAVRIPASVCSPTPRANACLSRELINASSLPCAIAQGSIE